jgi:hypothetical protein
MKGSFMDKQTKDVLKAIIEQDIIQSDFHRDRKDWVNVYRAIDGINVDDKPIKRVPLWVLWAYLISLIVAGSLSANLFSYLFR